MLAISIAESSGRSPDEIMKEWSPRAFAELAVYRRLRNADRGGPEEVVEEVESVRDLFGPGV